MSISIFIKKILYLLKPIFIFSTLNGFAVWVFNQKSSNCDDLAKYRTSPISGQVLWKGNAKSGSRVTGVIRLKDQNSNIIELNGANNFRVFDLVQIGDSFYKMENSTAFIFVNNGNELGQVYWECDE